MKKSLILLTIVLVVISAVTFTACSNVPKQSTLTTPWNDMREVSTYDVSYEEADTTKHGTMTVTYERYKGRDVTYPGLTIEPNFDGKEFHGFVITTNLQLDDGQYKESVVFTDTQLRARYSMAKSHYVNSDYESGYEDLSVEYTYDTKSVDYNVTGSITKSGTIKYKPFDQTAYFDNAFYIALTRTLGPINVQSQISFLTPSWSDEKMMKRVGGTTPQAVEIKPHDDLGVSGFTQPEDKEDKSMVTCLRSTILSGETMPGSGSPISYYLSYVPYTTSTGVVVNNVLLKFVEHDVTYLLKSIEMTPVAE